MQSSEQLCPYIFLDFESMMHRFLTEGPSLISESLKLAKKLETSLKMHSSIHLLEKTKFKIDPFKSTLRVPGLPGDHFNDLLFNTYGIDTLKYTKQAIVTFVHTAIEEGDIDALQGIIGKIVRENSTSNNEMGKGY